MINSVTYKGFFKRDFLSKTSSQGIYFQRGGGLKSITNNQRFTNEDRSTVEVEASHYKDRQTDRQTNKQTDREIIPK